MPRVLQEERASNRVSLKDYVVTSGLVHQGGQLDTARTRAHYAILVLRRLRVGRPQQRAKNEEDHH
jgi:hypothetical protein